MRIAIFGSSHSGSPGEGFSNVKEFASTCNSIGRALARAGHVLLVQSDSYRTADRYVVDGARQFAAVLFETDEELVVIRQIDIEIAP